MYNNSKIIQIIAKMESKKTKELNEIMKTIQNMYIEFSNEILKKIQTKIKLEIKSEYV